MRQLTLIAALSAVALPAVADDTALLMGVARYDELRRVSDGNNLLRAADDLGDAGYDVSTLQNGSIRDMNRLLATFAENVTLGDRLVVGLSGRFVTDAERTWFLGDNAQTPAPFNLDGAVSVETVMQVMAQSPGQSVLLLGYPQSSTNSFGSFLREGVGDLDIPQGVTVIYGEPNALQSVLSDAITAPDGDVMDFVRSSRRLTALGFQPQSLVMQPNDDGVVVTLPPVDTSITAWNEAQQANSIEAYTAFRTEYPRSPFAQEAQRRISELEQDPVRLAELAEAGLNLSRNERRAIQRNLTLLDFNTRGVDGIFGPGSRGAIRNWQQDNGFAQTSFLTPSQINRIDGQARRRAAEIEAEEEQAREDALRLDREFWEETGARGDEAGFVAYLDQYPQGTFADEAREGLAELNPPAPEVDNSAARAREDALNINPVLRRLIETRLAGLGYNPGQQDGRFDRNTRRALADYQRASNLTATGFIDQPTLARLLADTFGR